MTSDLAQPASDLAQPNVLLAAQNIAVLEQGLAVFDRLTTELYVGVPEGLTPSAVGGHFRHIHDYFRCFLRGVAEGRVDYDLRERDGRFEVDLEHAGGELAETIDQLRDLVDPDQELTVKMDAPKGVAPQWSRTTVGRELRFLLSHTIHHYALIAMILKVQGFDCGEGFGVAPSTLDYWESRPSCAPSPGSEA